MMPHRLVDRQILNTEILGDTVRYCWYPPAKEQLMAVIRGRLWRWGRGKCWVQAIA